jgi:NTP pyrophosphatase (non-canonical NTP hydrolase)
MSTQTDHDHDPAVERWAQAVEGVFDALTRAAQAATLASMTAEVREVNTANGWLDDERTVGDDIALLHSEASEALEAYRDHGLNDATAVYVGHAADYAHVPQVAATLTPLKPEGFGSELADVLIRLLDTADRRGIDLHAEYVRKVTYNRTRDHRHGGKLL